MKYKCLVFDHDDTVVNSTATIHHPCFQKYLNSRYPGRTCSLEDYFKKNFAPRKINSSRKPTQSMHVIRQTVSAGE